ncbi:MAG: LysE/ArgO family amino acid transporter [Actinomycetes bacterium]
MTSTNLPTVLAFIPGFLTGLSLIVAIGAQNAFVIKQGLARQYVLLVVVICTLSDLTLIALGVGGLGKIVQSNASFLEVIRWFGVAYLTWFGIKTLRSVFKKEKLITSEYSSESIGKIARTTLALTWLNPHVYLDTVILLGTVSNQFKEDRWIFSAGAMLASTLWFVAIGFGAQSAARFMSRSIFWKVLDGVIAAIMFSIAILLAFYNF